MSSGESNGCEGASGDAMPSVVELNVGGVFYTTALSTLTKEPESLLGQLFGVGAGGEAPPPKDAKGRFFLDRDGVLFRYVLDFLRNQRLVLPDNFQERDRLRQEAIFFRLPALAAALQGRALEAAEGGVAMGVVGGVGGGGRGGYITVGYRGSFAFGRDGLADVKFRKLSRILVCGRVLLCREVFGETLNESRDPDRGPLDRYTGRFFLKHTFLEQAFDLLQDAGFRCVASCGSGTAGVAAELKPGQDTEEVRWNHYNEFVFVRE